MGNYNYAIRRYNRYVKAMRRLREDRAEHGGYDPGRYGRFVCVCFLMEDKQTNGKTFSRFADYPAWHSGYSNPRRYENGEKWKLTRQERRAPTPAEWE